MTQHKKRLPRLRVPRFIKTVIFLGMAVSLFAGGALLLWASTIELPDFDTFSQRKVAQSTKIYDRTGKVLLYDIHGTIQRTVVPFSQISQNIKNATLAIEDNNFYLHRGIQPRSIARALLANLGSGSAAQGGSTITQQVVKNSLLTKEKSISRKIKEAIIALKLERVMAKDDIFSLYLNESPYGGNVYGVEEASHAFFGKKASEVTLAEAAYIASLPKAPTYYSPYGPNRAKLDGRKNTVLDRMLELGLATKEEYEAAKNEKVVFQADQTGGIKAPHFVMFIRGMLEEKYGRDALENGGFKVITSLDWSLQEKAEQIVAKSAKENEKKFNAKNASMIGIDPKTGQILVMVGSRDYFDTENDGNFNIALSERQPGSSFKPFVYAAAFEKGYTPETVLFDLQTQFETGCTTEGVPLSGTASCYTPENYDHVYRGPVSLRNALAQSINIPAIKTLYLVGISDAIKTARTLGIKSLTNANRYGLTLVLGGGEVSLLEMTSAYGVFANDGVRNPYEGILRVEDLNGNLLEEFSPHPETVLSKNVTRQISDILSDNVARAPAFGENSALNITERQVAVKTGTTNDYRDAWIIGYTPNFVLGAWAGNNDNSPMEKKVAGFIVAPMWNSFMREAIKSLPEEHFVKPEKPENYSSLKPVLRGIWQGGETYTVDKSSGNLASDFTPHDLKEEQPINSVHSILYWVDKKNPMGPKPEHPENDPQFELWEKPIRAWAETQSIVDQDPSTLPKAGDTTHDPSFAPHMSILFPLPGAALPRSSRATVSISLTATKFPVSQADFFINGNYIGSTKNAPYSFSFIPAEITGIQGVNELRVVGFDTMGNRTETKVSFSVI